MNLVFDRAVTGDLEAALSREWLETNGIGGWAGSTVAGAHTRRYHGLLVAATRPPGGRRVLLSRLDETIRSGNRTDELGCNRFPGVVHPRGFELIESFAIDPFPRFTYRAGEVCLQKTIAAIHGENTTVVVYEVLEADDPLVLELRPLYAARDFHGLTRAGPSPGAFAFSEGVLRFDPAIGGPSTYVAVPAAEFRRDQDWFLSFELDRERERGFAFTEDLFTPGVLAVELAAGARLGIVASTRDPAGRDAEQLLEEERTRRNRRDAALPPAVRSDPLAAGLARAADAFVVRRGKAGRTVIAGYPWFGDWGRDAMIALPGLCMVTGRLDEAAEVLETFVGCARDGLLPNLFDEDGDGAAYNTVDASLWLFVAVHHYLAAGGEEALILKTVYPALKEIVGRYTEGTAFGIGTDGDGLLRAGEHGAQLTWMDARIGDRVVTPRHGKAVEVNALWFNALVILAGLADRFGEPRLATELEARAARVRSAFAETFWNASDGCLYDVVRDGERDASIRPNQLLAISLPHPLLDPAQAEQVLRIIEAKLLTAVGLRSLAPDHPDYRPAYRGGPVERDAAYHQGTVWAWLMGPYLSALVRYRGAAGRHEALKRVEALVPHLAEAGLGQVSEIFDGEPPHAPRGAIAQAWSVGEILRAYVQEVMEPTVPARPADRPTKRASKRPARKPARTPAGQVEKKKTKKKTVPAKTAGRKKSGAGTTAARKPSTRKPVKKKRTGTAVTKSKATRKAVTRKAGGKKVTGKPPVAKAPRAAKKKPGGKATGRTRSAPKKAKKQVPPAVKKTRRSAVRGKSTGVRKKQKARKTPAPTTM